MKFKYIICIAALSLSIAGCRHAQGWSVSGSLDSPADSRIALEGFNNGRWYLIDSIDVDAKGAFAWQAEAPAEYPDVYRLSSGSAAVYFPIDATDAISISGPLADAHISGTPAADRLQRVNDLIAVAVASGAELAGDTPLKHKLIEEIAADSTGIVSYYIINKSVGGNPLFDPSNRFDNRIYGAVAQRFTVLRPDDSRTRWLTSTYLAGKATFSELPADTREIEADVTGLIDIDLYDNRGTAHRLSEVAGKGHPVLLSFTRYDLDASAAYNVLLNEIYAERHPAGLEIYQVAFDPDDVIWKENAANLPWLTLYCPAAKAPTIIAAYNVGMLPLTYIIDSNGDIAARVADPTRLKSALSGVK